MTLYQQKTQPFEAIQWTCDNYEDIKAFTNSNVAITADEQCIIVNGETVCENDWVLKFTSNGNPTPKFFVATNTRFQENYEAYQGLQ